MSAVAELEQQIEDLKPVIERRNLALVLSKNKDFKTLIIDYFSVDECARYLRVSVDPERTPEQRADALAMSQAAGRLRLWLSLQVRMGNQAESELAEAQVALDEVRNEEG